MRFLLLAILVSVHTFSFAAKRELSHAEMEQDYEFLCREVAATYAYFDSKATAWKDVCELYRGDLKAATSRDFVHLLERMLDELYDPHVQLNVNTATSPRLVPSGTDLWAEWRDGKAIITEVRANSDAQRAGIEANAIVVTIDGQPIDKAVEARLGRSYPHSTHAARDWALRAVLAGTHNAARRLTIQIRNASKTVELPAQDQFKNNATPITHSIIQSNVGYVRCNDSLGNDQTIAAFDQALQELQNTRALIVDLRNTASGGNSTVARGILGRFVDRELPYQKHVMNTEERATGVRRSWLELVSPRGPFTYKKPVVVLVDHWTGSMGEGLAIGFDAVGAGKIIGTSMAQLLGATYTIALPHSGFSANVPAEKLFHVNGTPRENVQPSVLVDVATKSSTDAFIEAALKVFAQ